MKYLEERKDLCRIAKSVYDRQLTNAVGGNFSIQVAEKEFLVSATGMSVHKLWDMQPEDVLLIDDQAHILEGTGKLTREINMHQQFYQRDPRIKAVMHAHPKDLMVFAAKGESMSVVTEALTYLGADQIPCLPYQPATTQLLADEVGKFIQQSTQLTNLEIMAYGAILNKHGIIIGGASLYDCNELLEMMETNAYCVNVTR